MGPVAQLRKSTARVCINSFLGSVQIFLSSFQRVIPIRTGGGGGADCCLINLVSNSHESLFENKYLRKVSFDGRVLRESISYPLPLPNL